MFHVRLPPDSSYHLLYSLLLPFTMWNKYLVLLPITGIKDYSNWPTIPQVYVDGEFLGGCDIMIEMHKNGELIEELKKVGIVSPLIEAATKDKS